MERNPGNESHSHKSNKRDKVKHSATGMMKHHGEPAKQGGGGKGTWGHVGDEIADLGGDANFNSADYVYRFVCEDEWKQAQNESNILPNELDTKDGYMHLSSFDQLTGVDERYFKGKKNVVLVEYFLKELPEVKWDEVEFLLNEKYPHYYGNSLPIKGKKVSRVFHLKERANGTHEFANLNVN